MPPHAKAHLHYQYLRDKEEDHDETSRFVEADSFIEKIPSAFQHRYKPIKPLLPWLIHLLLLALYFTLAINHIWTSISVTERGIMNPANVPIAYELHTFFGNVRPGDFSPFQGPSNAETDAMWNTILDLDTTVLTLTDEEAAMLPESTAELSYFNNQEGYVGVLEVFHQLHCLNRIRKHFYNHTRNEAAEPLDILKTHDDHCFDYLRQVIICHGDTSIMSLLWNPLQGMYNAKFNITKEYRDWDAIHEWGLSRRATLGGSKGKVEDADVK